MGHLTGSFRSWPTRRNSGTKGQRKTHAPTQRTEGPTQKKQLALATKVPERLKRSDQGSFLVFEINFAHTWNFLRKFTNFQTLARYAETEPWGAEIAFWGLSENSPCFRVQGTHSCRHCTYCTGMVAHGQKHFSTSVTQSISLATSFRDAKCSQL